MSGELSLGWDAAGEALRLRAEDLRTHAVVVGMTGSGKTGLCIVLLEELAQAGVAVIAIDPKGDLCNLALLFPEQSAAEFAPWVEDGADAAQAADRWRKGLADSGLGPERVAALRARMALRIFTPGSEAGSPVDVLGAFRRPAGEIDGEELRTLVSGTVSGLLGLVGRESDPVRDPAHVVLSTILEQAWAAGEDPDLQTLILRLVDPPFAKVGVFPLDRFFPPDDRMDLAMLLNGVVASPGFAAWTRGDPLDLDALLGGPAGLPARDGGRTPVHVFSLAHLADAQRQFFLALLLGRLRTWSRSQPGTSALRAVLFIDEALGCIPPDPRQPATKAPLLAMLKQSRAVGLGVVLATQNPVDLDYKAISNAGLWFLGRLQTRQDRDRLLKGIGRPELDEQVGALEARRFLVLDAHCDTPRLLRTRWAMSYLRGPFTRADIQAVRPLLHAGPAPTPSAAAPLGAPSSAAAPAGAPAGAPVAAPPAAAPPSDPGLLSAPPPAPGDTWILDPRVAFSARLEGRFADLAGPARADGRVELRPGLLAELELRFDEERAGFVLDHHELRIWYPLDQGLPAEPARLELQAGDLLPSAEPGSLFHPLPAWVDEPRELTELSRQVVEDVYRTETRGMFVHTALKLYGRAGETRADFDARVKAAVEARIDAEVARLKDKAERDGKRIEDKLVQLRARQVDYQGVVRSRQAEEAVNVGETLLSWFSGRKRSVTTAVSKRRQTVAAQDKVERTEQEINDLVQEAYEADRAIEAEVARIRTAQEALLGQGEERQVRLERTDIRLARFGIVWIPATRRM